MVEQMLKWNARCGSMRGVSLRYFNVGGAAFGVGEAYVPETHLIPRPLWAAAHGERAEIFGGDYSTPGTCVRDYRHVADLVDAHLAAIQRLEDGGRARSSNLGGGAGQSVGDVLRTVRHVTRLDLPADIRERRPGDPPTLVGRHWACPPHASLDAPVGP